MARPTPSAQLDRPMFLRRLSTDEYQPWGYSGRDRAVILKTRDRLGALAEERNRPLAEVAVGRAGTAAGLRELNAEWGDEFYAVPENALRDDEAASAVFDGPELVIDVQTHFVAPHCQKTVLPGMVMDLMRSAMPSWWTEMDDLEAYDLGAYIRNVFLETETAVAVLTSGPGLDDWRNLFNDEIAATRTLVDGLAGTGRLLTHSVVHPNVDQDLAAMEEYRDAFKPSGWKVYTLGVLTPEGPVKGWKLCDEDGFRFLERAWALDVKLVCAHKGISWLVDNGSPDDIGPAAKAFPDVDFLVYHSGYEMPTYGAPAEGPFSDETADVGINRLINSVRQNGIGVGGNVYAELGTTWYCLVRRPVEAAHVLGKLIATLGADNVIWGTDSIYYGGAQPLVDAFRAFQIPDRMCDEFGYQKLTPEIKEKILSLNAARLYGVDVPAMRERVKRDDLSWARQLVKDYYEHGFAGLR